MYVLMMQQGIELWHAYARSTAAIWYVHWENRMIPPVSARDRRFALYCKLRGVLVFDRITRKMRDPDYVV